MIDHSLTWLQGELHEMRWLLLGSTLLFGFGLAAKLLGTTPYARGVAWPLMAFGLAVVVMGAGFTYNNLQRQRTWPAAYAADGAGFAKAEKERVAEFVAWYPRTRLIGAGIAACALLVLHYAEASGFDATARPVLWGWGLVGFLFAGFLFVVDHFSEERARAYAAALGVEV